MASTSNTLIKEIKMSGFGVLIPSVLLIILCQKTVLVNQKMCVVYHRSGKIIIAERIV